MGRAGRGASSIRFGSFEADLGSGELRRDAKAIRLPDQPFRVLAALLERPGQLVTREELQRRIWASETFVDFERGLNKAMNRLREVLGDSAEDPVFIETLPRRGYRFIARVEHRIGSLAVLPLENLSGDPGLEYWADGMTDELVNHLARMSGLRVISRTSVMRFKRNRAPLPEIAAQLDVDALIEGSVMIAGKSVRIRVQLVDAATDSHLWAENYDGELMEAANLQVRIAESIARQIRSRLLPEEAGLLAKKKSVSPEAYEAYLKGRFFWNMRTEPDLNRSVDYFHHAIALDPEYAMAYYGLASAFGMIGVFALRSPVEVYPLAEIAAQKALALDPLLAEAHAAMAFVNLQFKWDWASAEKEFQRAIELNPNYAVAHQWYAFLLSLLRRTEESIEEVRKARQLDPLSTPINGFVGFVYMKARRCAEAVEACRKAIEIDPSNPFGHWMLARAFDVDNKLQEALAEAEKAAALSGGSMPYESHLGYALARIGDEPGAQRILNRLTELETQRYISPYDVAIIYAALGNHDETLQWLEKAYVHRTSRLTELSDPGFDNVRFDPRFQDLTRRVGLP